MLHYSYDGYTSPFLKHKTIEKGGACHAETL